MPRLRGRKMGRLDTSPIGFEPNTTIRSYGSATPNYIADLADELCRMADAGHMEVVAALLRLASVEARRIADRSS